MCNYPVPKTPFSRHRLTALLIIIKEPQGGLHVDDLILERDRIWSRGMTILHLVSLFRFYLGGLGSNGLEVLSSLQPGLSHRIGGICFCAHPSIRRLGLGLLACEPRGTRQRPPHPFASVWLFNYPVDSKVRGGPLCVGGADQSTDWCWRGCSASVTWGASGTGRPQWRLEMDATHIWFLH